MTDHKFEPGQLVLVRDADNDIWQLAHYDYLRESGMHGVIGGFGWSQCIPFNEETKHLHRTSQPYDPPKPPVDEYKRFKCGEWVEVLYFEKWVKALFLFYNGVLHCAFVPSGNKPANTFAPDQIRPLPDTAAH